MLKIGDSGSAVKRWQAVVGVPQDGVFGPNTDAATRAWQASRHLTVDGIVGPRSWATAGVTIIPCDEIPPPPISTQPSLPGVVQARYYTPREARTIRLIVIHTAETPETHTAAEGVAGYFAGANAPHASAHYVVDCDSTVQSVADHNVAWHTPGALGDEYVNDFSIGIEHAGTAAQDAAQWGDEYSESMLARSAALVARLCKAYGIPMVRLTADDLKAGRTSGITGHADCTKATGVGTHWDPGPSFPWEQYLAQVNS